MSVKVKWFDSFIDKKVKKVAEAYKHEIGQGLVNEFVEHSPVKYGTLKNSFHYRIDGFKSEFGNESGPEKGDSRPPSDAILSKPPIGYVRAGSALIYADRVNKVSKTGSAGYANRAIDFFISSQTGMKLAKKVFRKFFK